MVTKLLICTNYHVHAAPPAPQQKKKSLWEDNWDGLNTYLGNLGLQLADSLAPLSQSTLKVRDLIGPQPCQLQTNSSLICAGTIISILYEY